MGRVQRWIWKKRSPFRLKRIGDFYKKRNKINFCWKETMKKGGTDGGTALNVLRLFLEN
jgi:hypothetical protein